MGEALGSSGSSTAINSSNIGFQLLKKHGWKEGTGLGVSEQGRLEPVEAHVKNNKKGLGAEKKKRKISKPTDSKGKDEDDVDDNDEFQKQKSSKKTKALSKRMRKLQEHEKRLQQQEFQRAFFREFWPDNV